MNWHLAVPPEVLAEYAGTTLDGYYTDAGIKLRTQTEGRRIFREKFGIDTGGPHCDPPAYVGVAALGMELLYPEGHQAQTGPPILSAAAAARELSVPDDYLAAPAMRLFVEMQERMQDISGQPVKLGAGVEGPVTEAKLLRGEDFFLDCYDHPELVRELLAVITDSLISFTRQVREHNADPLAGAAGVADDFAGMLPPEMFDELVMPCYERIYTELAGPGGRRSMHSELLKPAHLPAVARLGLAALDLGQDEHVTIEDWKRLLDVPVQWNILTISEMLRGSPERIRAKCDELAEAGVARVVAEICTGTPEENVRAFLAAGRELGEVA